MNNWLPILIIAIATFSCLQSQIEATQCSVQDKSPWRLFSTLDEFGKSKVTYNLLEFQNNTGTNVQILSSKPNLSRGDFNVYEAKYIIRMTLVNLDILSLGNGTFDGLQCLEILDLQLNAISTMSRNSLEGLNHLRVLNMSRNRFEQLTDDMFPNMPSLLTLDFSLNKIRMIAPNTFQYMHKLQHLNLSYNRIYEADFPTWSVPVSIEIVNLTHNTVDTVKTDSSVTYPYLTRIDVSNNLLTFIDPTSTKIMAPNLALYFIHNNRIRCATLKKITDDFRSLKIFHTARNITPINVDGIDCVGRLDEPSDFEKNHPTLIFPENIHDISSPYASHLEQIIILHFDALNMSLAEPLLSVRAATNDLEDSLLWIGLGVLGFYIILVIGFVIYVFRTMEFRKMRACANWRVFKFCSSNSRSGSSASTGDVINNEETIQLVGVAAGQQLVGSSNPNPNPSSSDASEAITTPSDDLFIASTSRAEHKV